MANEAIPRYWWIGGHCPPYESYYSPCQLLHPQYNLYNLKGELRTKDREQNSCLWSKIQPMTKQPLNNLKCTNAIVISYLSENELIWVIWGHSGLKQPRNCKFKFGWARAVSTGLHLKRSVDFFSGLIIWNRTYSKSPQNLRSYDILHDHIALETKPWQYF